MAQEIIAIGADNEKEGDVLPVCFTKTNNNFTELYGAINPDAVAAAPAGSMFVSDGAGGGEFIRIQGWQQVSDSRTTVGTPTQTLVSGVRTQWINNGVASNIQKLPSDAMDQLWNTTDNKIDAISEFDTYNVRFDFRAESYSGSTPYITIEVDIGGTQGVIASETKALIKGGSLQRLLTSMPLFSGSDFLANGAKIYLTYVGGADCAIFSNNILIVRESKNYV